MERSSIPREGTSRREWTVAALALLASAGRAQTPTLAPAEPVLGAAVPRDLSQAQRDGSAARASAGERSAAFHRRLNDRAPLTRNLDGLQRKAIRRRRAAVLAADVVGYVRLMDDYEEATHLRVMALRRLVVDPFVRGHEGRVVKNTGDGFLAEFGDVHDALQCALAIQRTVAKNGTVAGNATVCYRMGLHCGPVIVEPEDVYGHVVNLAARLQTLAPPGRVVVSATARAEIERAAREVVFLDYGVHAVKNVRESVQAYVVVPSSYGEPAYR